MPLSLQIVDAPLHQVSVHPDTNKRVSEPRAIVESVEPESLGELIGLEPGDEILAINGQVMEDVIDYRFLITEEEVELRIAPSGDRSQVRVVELEKDVDETLGVTFTRDTFDGIRLCNNDCDFCFVYQNRPRMRRSLAIKDDDYRLSFLHGDFVTLTNLSERDFQRIIDLHLSPLYVSVHSTDPDVRVQCLRNPRAALIREHMARLLEAGITLHTQIVLCPGLNDGAVLEQTVADLAALHPGVQSLAVVPVGLTRFRGQLPTMRTVSHEEAKAVVERVASWQREFRRTLGTRFVWASDEMYLLAGAPVPAVAVYEGLPQRENGVGMVADFRAEWRRARRRLPERVQPTHAALVTGTLAAPLLREVAADLNGVGGLRVEVAPVQNHFYGASVTVAGLLVGEDLVAQLRDHPAERLLVPDVLMGRDRTLDDMTPADLAAELGRPVEVIPNRARALAEWVRAKAA